MTQPDSAAARNRPDSGAIDALADAWSSIDGRVDRYRHGRDNPTDPAAVADGSYAGYQWEAEELIRRLRRRGYDVTALEVAHADPA